jgi:hypothetical protein
LSVPASAPWLAMALAVLGACTHEPSPSVRSQGPPPSPASHAPPAGGAPENHAPPSPDGASDTMSQIPAHLRHFPGLYVRSGNDIVPAPDEDVAVAKGYPDFPDKGPWRDGRRITIMSAQTSVQIGDPVRVVHVAETTRPGDELYLMGPKPVLGEHVDGQLRTQPAPVNRDPLEPPGLFDGRTQKAPAVDYNRDITEYRFDTAGRHTIVWKPGDMHSNELVIDVR